MLLPEENTLAIMKWRLQQMEPSNRWYRVLDRYIGIVAGRVQGLGGDPGSIQPDPGGVPVGGLRECRDVVEFTGCVEEALYDCFGGFEGFLLRDCCRTVAFRSCEPGLSDLILRCLKERLRLTVFATAGKEPRIQRVAITA
jgi:hypothetical protein